MRRAVLEPHNMPEPGKEGSLFTLPDDPAHYLRDVLRLDPGEHVELLDGSGRVVEVVLLGVGDKVKGRILSDRQSEKGESFCQLTLLQAIPKGDRWEWLLEKATELGVHRIVPLETRRTVVQISDRKVDRKLDRWERILTAAARQCQRARTPEIEAPTSVEESLEAVDADVRIVAHTSGDGEGLPTVLRNAVEDADADRIAIWIGPEGGFDDDEVDHFASADVSFCHLGPRILRSETAGITAAALVQASIGDMK